MKIKSLKIQFFRGIEDLILDLDPNINVFIGINGVGKSSILDCIAIFLASLIQRIRTPRSPLPIQSAELRHDGSLIHDASLTAFKSFVPPILIEQDIKNGKNETSCEITISTEGLDDFQLSTRLIREGIEEDIDEPTDSKPDELARFSKLIYSQLRKDPKASIPIAIYYRTDRAISHVSLESVEEITSPQIAAYDKAIIGGKTDFSDFFTWFRNREDLENEMRRDGNLSYSDQQLVAVRQAVSKLLPDFTDLRVRRSPLRMTVNKVINNQEHEVIISQLSDGEKCLLAMVGDLARRLAIANPGLSNPLNGQGIIMIDEIELHLHPQWQRGIVPKLIDTFPNCQFIITTHSPQVISDVQASKIYVLEPTSNGITAKRPDNSFGRDTNRILEDLMRVPERPESIKNKLYHLFQLIDDGRLNEARELQKKLENLLGDDEPEFAKADVLIRRKEILGR